MGEHLFAIQGLSLQMLKEPNTEQAQQYAHLIKALDKTAVADLQPCLIFPLLRILRKRDSKLRRLQEVSLTTLQDILCRSRLVSWSAFKDIAGSTCVMLQDTLKKEKDVTLDEVFYETLLETMSIAFRACSSTVWAEAFGTSRDVVSVLWSNIVFLCVDLINKSSARNVRASALGLIQQTLVPELRTDESKAFLAGLFASFLPGITATCSSVLAKPAGSPFVGTQLMVQALNTFSSVLCTVFDNSLRVHGPASPESSGTRTAETSTTVRASSAWLEETVPKIAIAVRSVDSVVISADISPEVASTFICFAELVITKCDRTLRPCLVHLVRTVIIFSEHQTPEISDAATRCVENLKEASLPDQTSLVWIDLQDDLISSFEALTSTVESGLESSIVASFKLCCGYVKLFGSRLSWILGAGNVLDRVIFLLLSIAELDYTTTDLMAYREFDTNEPSILPCSLLKLTKSSIATLFFRFTSRLGTVGVQPGMLSRLTEEFLRNSLTRCETLLVLRCLLDGVEKSDGPVLDQLSMVLEVLLQSDGWTLSTSAQAAVLSRRCITEGWSQADEKTLLQLKKDVVCLQLLLQNIAAIAKVMGTAFRQHLHVALYMILEKTESEIPPIQSTALHCLSQVAEACQYASIADLVCDNMEYLINDIVLRVRQLHRHPKTIFVLKAVLSYTDKNALPEVAHIVEVVLDKLDEFHHAAPGPFAAVLLTVVVKMKRWFPASKKVPAVRQDSKVYGVIRYLRTGYRDQTSGQTPNEGNEMNGTVADEEEVEEEGTIETEEKKEEVPQHVKLTVEIVRRSAYLLLTEDRHLRSLLLDVIREGCEVIQSRQEQLLPLAHKIWQSLITFHRGSDFIIMRKAFECLVGLTSVAGGFLRYRVVNEAIPLVAKFVGTRSLNRSRYSDEWDPGTRLTISFISLLPQLLKNIEAEDSAWEICATAVLPFLDAEQPKFLQEAALAFFQGLAGTQPDLVHVKLTEVSCIDEDQPVHNIVHEDIFDLFSNGRCIKA
ncbi:hypothetical protein RvY_17661-2 [Ramazzottius varieornatus]|uniref:Uncharacterized protein n=1 Tax=Ramazzottius varieornatus TaxID=947166 RepID=A0A1D1W2X3_RAMVA|nr:hypothetical protein RvY_17661-2 [Ramazzottius varieornatus]